MSKATEFIAREIDRLEGLRHDAAEAYSRSQNATHLRRMRRFQFLIADLRSEFARRDAGMAVAR